MTERQAIESTYFDKLCSYRRVNIFNEATKLSNQEEQLVLENIPCAISKSKNSLNQTNVLNIENSYVLFASPDLDLKAGDKVVVTCQSGQIKTCYFV